MPSLRATRAANDDPAPETFVWFARGTEVTRHQGQVSPGGFPPRVVSATVDRRAFSSGATPGPAAVTRDARGHRATRDGNRRKTSPGGVATRERGQVSPSVVSRWSRPSKLAIWQEFLSRGLDGRDSGY